MRYFFFMGLVVVCDFDVEGLSADPAEAEAVLVVDADAVLPLAVALQCLEPVTRRQPKVVERGGCLQLGEFAQGGLLDRRW